MAVKKRRVLPRREAVRKPFREARRGKLNDVVLDYDIFEMAQQGYNALEISKALEKRGASLQPETINNRIRKVLQNVQANSLSNVEDVRRMEVAKLDRMEAKLNGMLSQKNIKTALKIQLIRELKDLGQSRHKLLGLQTQKIEQKSELTVRIYKGLEEGDVPETPQISVHYPMLPGPESAENKPGPILIGQKSA